MKAGRMISMILVIALVCFSRADAAAIAKRTLKGNMTEVYRQLPETADSIEDMLLKGIFYGRVRINSFLWDWGSESLVRRNHWSAGVGGSAVFKSACFNGVGMTAGLYTSQNPWHMGGNVYLYAKAAKDTFSRYMVANGGGWEMTVLAQAYLEYAFMDSSVRVGRQLFESLLTASNDTKMIPNAFRGVALESDFLPDTRVKAAWLDQQKLRDHTTFHHVLAYGDDPENLSARWTQNDDSAMHRGLTLSKLREAGIDDRLIILQVENTTIRNLTLLFNVTDVPDLVGSITGEFNYSVNIGVGFILGSGFRYMSQRDHGGGEIGGASISGGLLESGPLGYRNPLSLEGRLSAAKISLEKGALTVLAGYSLVSDDADLVAPWRGFPTGGYTRAMGQYNWFANTESWMLQVDCDLAKAGFVTGFAVKARYVIQDYDDEKPAVPADSRVLNVDLLQEVTAVPGLILKLRTNFVMDDRDTADTGLPIKADPAYNEYRFEMNYLF